MKPFCFLFALTKVLEGSFSCLFRPIEQGVLNQGGEAGLLIRKHDHFTPARKMRRDADNHPVRKRHREQVSVCVGGRASPHHAIDPESQPTTRHSRPPAYQAVLSYEATRLLGPAT